MKRLKPFFPILCYISNAKRYGSSSANKPTPNHNNNNNTAKFTATKKILRPRGPSPFHKNMMNSSADVTDVNMNQLWCCPGRLQLRLRSQLAQFLLTQNNNDNNCFTFTLEDIKKYFLNDQHSVLDKTTIQMGEWVNYCIYYYNEQQQNKNNNNNNNIKFETVEEKEHFLLCLVGETYTQMYWNSVLQIIRIQNKNETQNKILIPPITDCIAWMLSLIVLSDPFFKLNAIIHKIMYPTLPSLFQTSFDWGEAMLALHNDNNENENKNKNHNHNMNTIEHATQDERDFIWLNHNNENNKQWKLLYSLFFANLVNISYETKSQFTKLFLQNSNNNKILLSDQEVLQQWFAQESQPQQSSLLKIKDYNVLDNFGTSPAEWQQYQNHKNQNHNHKHKNITGWNYSKEGSTAAQQLFEAEFKENTLHFILQNFIVLENEFFNGGAIFVKSNASFFYPVAVSLLSTAPMRLSQLSMALKWNLISNNENKINLSNHSNQNQNNNNNESTMKWNANGMSVYEYCSHSLFYFLLLLVANPALTQLQNITNEQKSGKELLFQDFLGDQTEKMYLKKNRREIKNAILKELKKNNVNESIKTLFSNVKKITRANENNNDNNDVAQFRSQEPNTENNNNNNEFSPIINQLQQEKAIHEVSGTRLPIVSYIFFRFLKFNKIKKSILLNDSNHSEIKIECLHVELLSTMTQFPREVLHYVTTTSIYNNNNNNNNENNENEMFICDMEMNNIVCYPFGDFLFDKRFLYLLFFYQNFQNQNHNNNNNKCYVISLKELAAILLWELEYGEEAACEMLYYYLNLYPKLCQLRFIQNNNNNNIKIRHCWDYEVVLFL